LLAASEIVAAISFSLYMEMWHWRLKGVVGFLLYCVFILAFEGVVGLYVQNALTPCQSKVSDPY